MQYENYRQDDTGGEPSIAEMTEKAIKILQKDDDGFFLMVEGKWKRCLSSASGGEPSISEMTQKATKILQKD